MTLKGFINDKRLDKRIKNGETLGFNCGAKTRIKVDSDGKIIDAKGLSFIMWSHDPLKIDEEVKGLHVNDFAELLNKMEAVPGNYNSFSKKVLPHYNSKHNTTSKRLIKTS